MVGENDSGKSAIIDAIRITMGTTDQGWYRLTSADFFQENKQLEISISLKFSNLSKFEQGAFLEYLSSETIDGEEKPCLHFHWKAKCLVNFQPSRFSISTSTGTYADGPALAPEARELLRVTYLRALRDSFLNMQSGKNSRLAQIIQSIPGIDEGKDYQDDGNIDDLSISGIASLSNKLLRDHPKLKEVVEKISSTLNTQMLLKGDTVSPSIEVAGFSKSNSKRLNELLEKLDLKAHSGTGAGRIGLGTSNILSMACELLLHRGTASSFLLIEEPEAHIHAQRQLRLIKTLQSQADANENSSQIIITTHSPLMASAVKLENLSIVTKSQVFSLKKEQTMLESDDYQYLERYLDATKANLFFAKSVLLVEGPSEELLLPCVARLIGKDLAEYGVSIVNVRGTGLFRFARIFKRKREEESLAIPVACVTDRDVMPDVAVQLCIDETFTDKSKWPEGRRWRTESDLPTQKEKEEHLQKICSKCDGQTVKTYVADYWTFEYDLAFAGLWDELAEAIIKALGTKGGKDKDELQRKRAEKIDRKNNEMEAAYLYSFLSRRGVSKPKTAECLAEVLEKKYSLKPEELRQKLPSYLIDAIDYVTTDINHEL